ncbi:MAG: DUF2442 domain-containing protein [Melioribacteraceae bacterium]|nr:DUF2442 domain-containing protein [Melioribacteraceae bacterium]MCF8356211.1 DUF2442 domain-containing protein [Melioribacteraceae bacterium]MCF8395864.1 DUF2442 domain-containing protein [Melioribacteraceae bacterium]MCF8420042.1 DUF2442 domain-containing protein [Melioribacteraceae bacterium]
MPGIKHVEVKGKDSIYVEYNDGIAGEYNFTRLFQKEDYSELSDFTEFQKISISKINGDVVWQCGTSLCKDALYKQLQLKQMMARLKITY